MNTLNWILLINLLGATKVINGVGKAESGILPLVLLRVSSYNSYIYPKHVERLTTKDGNISGGTEFSCWYDKEKCKQIFFCPPETSTSIDCLYPKEFGNDDILQCATEPSPFVEKMTYNDETGQKKDVSCGLTDGNGVWYKTGYKVCVPVPPKLTKREKMTQFLRLAEIKPTYDCSEFKGFQFCYNEGNKEVLFTDHETRSPQLFTDERFNNEFEKTFGIISNGYGVFSSIYQNDKITYEQLINSKQSEYEYTRQWLVPPEDLIFASWKKTAYNYLNIKPMRKDQLELWNYISDRVKKESIKIDKEFSIRTAAIVLPREDQPIYVIEPIEKPDVWIKFMFYSYEYVDRFGTLDKTSGLTIIMNSNLNEDAWQRFYNKYCDTNLCENVFNEKFPNVGNTVRCCYANEGTELLNLKFRINTVLKIDFS